MLSVQPNNVGPSNSGGIVSLLRKIVTKERIEEIIREYKERNGITDNNPTETGKTDPANRDSESERPGAEGSKEDSKYECHNGLIYYIDLLSLLKPEPEQRRTETEEEEEERSAKAAIEQEGQDESTPKNPIHGENGSVEKNN